MSEPRNRATIEALVEAINGRDLAAFDKVFTEDVVIEWPQSGERIRGSQKRR
jgi:ketosteroid isomerase-like protein